MKLNEKIKKIRKENNLFQEKLADKLNVSRQAITKWESGLGSPDIYNLKEISKLFLISIDSLLMENIEIENIKIEKNTIYNYEKTLEYDINYSKNYDIKICEIKELNVFPNNADKLKIRISSNEIEKTDDYFKIKIDDVNEKIDLITKG